ncbi:hypothetical protein IMZ48_15730 [Candidatus Bathyarchaeota archaeon]|nr:hypothetical protein [Candidatus Bathyarchaeota archaeon]
MERVEERDGHGTWANAVTIGLRYTYDLFVVFSVLTNGKGENEQRGGGVGFSWQTK